MPRLFILTRCCGLLLLLASVAAAVSPISYEPEFYEVSDEVVTPHVSWAEPLAGGPVRVLVIAPWYCHRHTVELMQRLDADVTVCQTTTRRALGYDHSIPSYAWVEGLFREDGEARLEEKLRGDYEVIVLGSDWSALPLDAVHRILEKVQGGTGLLIGYQQSGKYLDQLMAIGAADDAGWVLDGVPATMTANLEDFGPDAPLLRTSSLGEGRVLQFGYRMDSRAREYMTPMETIPATRQDYEVYQSLAIRALLWCARRETSLSVSMPEAPDFSPTDLPASLPLDVRTPQTLWRARIEAEWADPEGRVFETTSLVTRIPAGEATRFEFPVPALPDGRWFANLRVLVDRQVHGWACLPVTVSGGPTIESIEIKPELVPADEPAGIRIAFGADPPPPESVLELTVTDAFGRQVASATEPVGEGAEAIRIDLELPPPLCVWHEVEARLMIPDRDTPVAVKRAELFREWRRPPDEFTLLTWYGPARAGYMDHMINRAFAAAGVQTVYPSHLWGENVDKRCAESVRAGMSVLPYVCAAQPDRNATGPANQRSPAVTDPEYQQRLVDQVQNCARQLRRFCPAGYSLGDENQFTFGPEYDLAPSSVAFFREWLQRRYGSIERLNEAWHSEYNGFEEITPLLLAQAREANTPAPWIDFRLCMEDSWTGLFVGLREAIEQIDSGGKIGHEGSGGLDSKKAFDWWSMIRGLSLFVPYPGQPVQGNLVRSFRSPDTLSSYWYGAYTFSCGGRRPTTMRYFPWYCLLQTYNSSWYFNSYGHAGMAHELGFAPDLRPLPHFAETSAACAEIREGFDKLLLNSRRDTDGIAVLYSPTAIHENTYRKRPVAHREELDGLCRMLSDLSLQYEFISEQQLREGVLAARKHKLLILPLAMGMGPDEAKAVADFAAGGGAVLADLPPALADAHGHAYPQQPLAGLFGVQPGADDLALSSTGGAAGAALTLPDGDTMQIPGPAQTANGTPGDMRPAGHIGDQPVLLTNPEGRIALLNLTLAAYRGSRGRPTAGALRGLMAGVLAQLGVQPQTTVVGPNGQAIEQVEVFRFVNGPTQIVGVMPEDFNAREERDRPALVRLGKPWHVYDMRRKRYLGLRETVPLVLRTCRAELLACLPYSVGQVDLQASLDAERGHPTLTCTGTLRRTDGDPVAGTHAIHLSLTNPSGQRVGVYDRNVLTAEGEFAAQWHLAMNDPEGTWTVEAQDVSTGLSERIWVRIP